MLKQVVRAFGVTQPRSYLQASVARFSTETAINEEEDAPLVIGDYYSPKSISTKNATQVRPRDMDEALRIARAFSTAGYDETIQLNLNLGIDPRKPGQTVRGVARVPHASGKKAIVAVFAKGEKVSNVIFFFIIFRIVLRFSLILRVIFYDVFFLGC